MTNKRTPSNRRRRPSLLARAIKWTLVTFVSVGVVVSAIALIVYKWGENGATLNGLATTTSPAETGPATTPVHQPPGSVKPPARPKPTSDVADAVAAASAYNTNLGLAMLYPASETAELKRLITNTVVPRMVKRQTLIEHYGGQVLTRAWQYPSVAAAQANSGYTITTLAHRVERITATAAVIYLYTDTNFQTYKNLYDDTFYPVPSIVVVHLQKYKGRWMWVRAASPPASKVPHFAKGKHYTHDELLAAFEPYLRGYTSDVSSS